MPVVVSSDDSASGVMQFERGITQGPGHIERWLAQGRPERAQKKLLGGAARDLESCDQDVLAGAYGQPRRDISKNAVGRNEIIAHYIEADSFRRRCCNIRGLARAVKGILHKQAVCRAKAITVIVSKIALRSLVKLNDEMESLIDREKTLATRAGIARVQAGPGE